MLLTLHAQTLDEAVLSSLKSQEFEYAQEKVEAENSKLRDSWLNPITFNYSGSFRNQFGYDQQSYSAGVSIDQPIFKSGGIYFAIKYANASAHFSNMGIAMEKNGIIAQTFSLIMQLRKVDLNIEKIALQQQDAQALWAHNLEQLAVGEIDSAKVAEQEIVLNDLHMALIDLENQKRELLHQLKIFSDVDYATVTLPKLALVEESDFLSHHFELEQLQAKQERDRYFKNVTMTKYLPTLSATASYNYINNINQVISRTFVIDQIEANFGSYGFRLTMPLLDINTFVDIQSAKVDYLKSGVELRLKKEELARFYRLEVDKIKSLEKKSTLAQKNYALYKNVFALIADGYKVGDRSLLEYDRSKNSLEQRAKEMHIIELDKQIELLKLYEKLHDL